MRWRASGTYRLSGNRRINSLKSRNASSAADWSRWNARGLNASVEFRKRSGLPPERFIDISFYDFMEQPIEQVQRIYAHFDLAWHEDTETRMRDYLANNTAEQHGAHSYSFEDTGLDLAGERERVSSYQEYFDVPLEIR